MIKVLLDELTFLKDLTTWQNKPNQPALISYGQAWKAVAKKAIARYEIPRGNWGWFEREASHRFLTFLMYSLELHYSIKSATQMTSESLNKIARWLNGQHPDWTVEDEINILDATMERRHEFVIDLLGAICPKERPSEVPNDLA